MSIVQKFVKELLPVWTQRKKPVKLVAEPEVQPVQAHTSTRLHPGPKPAFKPKPRNGSDYASNM